ncbi:hypothetical protein OUZ56_032607 [Daphnia magna]|uniref:Uncharacterized protein n=1 Tax=Daphnia magna TaxID=35525 RepID=A0ABR0B9E4_9CRUS|nr:hypothetical protein OUZ56_032607 [Daphnia magna]
MRGSIPARSYFPGSLPRIAVQSASVSFGLRTLSLSRRRSWGTPPMTAKKTPVESRGPGSRLQSAAASWVGSGSCLAAGSDTGVPAEALLHVVETEVGRVVVLIQRLRAGRVGVLVLRGPAGQTVARVRVGGAGARTARCRRTDAETLVGAGLLGGAAVTGERETVAGARHVEPAAPLKAERVDRRVVFVGQHDDREERVRAEEVFPLLKETLVNPFVLRDGPVTNDLRPRIGLHEEVVHRLQLGFVAATDFANVRNKRRERGVEVGGRLVRVLRRDVAGLRLLRVVLGVRREVGEEAGVLRLDPLQTLRGIGAVDQTTAEVGPLRIAGRRRAEVTHRRRDDTDVDVGDRLELGNTVRALAIRIGGINGRLTADRLAVGIDAVRGHKTAHEDGDRLREKLLLVGHRCRVVDGEEEVDLVDRIRLLLRREADLRRRARPLHGTGQTGARSGSKATEDNDGTENASQLVQTHANDLLGLQRRRVWNHNSGRPVQMEGTDCRFLPIPLAPLVPATEPLEMGILRRLHGASTANLPTLLTVIANVVGEAPSYDQNGSDRSTPCTRTTVALRGTTISQPTTGNAVDGRAPKQIAPGEGIVCVDNGLAAGTVRRLHVAEPRLALCTGLSGGDRTLDQFANRVLIHIGLGVDRLRLGDVARKHLQIRDLTPLRRRVAERLRPLRTEPFKDATRHNARLVRREGLRQTPRLEFDGNPVDNRRNGRVVAEGRIVRSTGARPKIGNSRRSLSRRARRSAPFGGRAAGRRCRQTSNRHARHPSRGRRKDRRRPSRGRTPGRGGPPPYAAPGTQSSGHQCRFGPHKALVFRGFSPTRRRLPSRLPPRRGHSERRQSRRRKCRSTPASLVGARRARPRRRSEQEVRWRRGDSCTMHGRRPCSFQHRHAPLCDSGQAHRGTRECIWRADTEDRRRNDVSCRTRGAPLGPRSGEVSPCSLDRKRPHSPSKEQHRDERIGAKEGLSLGKNFAINTDVLCRISVDFDRIPRVALRQKAIDRLKLGLGTAPGLSDLRNELAHRRLEVTGARIRRRRSGKPGGLSLLGIRR